MAISFFGQASDPADGGTKNGPTSTITPPASMALNDYVVVVCHAKNETRTLTVGTTGGQTWTSETNRQDATSGMTSRVFRCRFNGAWLADPTFVADTGSAPQTAWMVVFRDVDLISALDVAEAGAAFAVPATPFDVTLSGITTATNGAMAIFAWGSADDNDWALQTAGWSNPAGITQVKNLAGTDISLSIGYKAIATAGATGSVTNRQTARGGDAGIYHTLALKPSVVGGQTIAVGQALETDSATAVTNLKAKVIGLSTEADTATALVKRKAKAVAQATEADTAQAIAKAKAKVIAQATEADTGSTVTPPARVSQATEVGTAQAIAKAKAKAIAQVAEADTAQAISKSKARAIGRAVEVDAAASVVQPLVKAIAQAVEVDLAQAVSRTVVRAVGQAVEVDAALGIVRQKVRAIGQALEIDSAFPVLWAKVEDWAQGSAADWAQATEGTWAQGTSDGWVWAPDVPSWGPGTALEWADT